MSDFKASLKFGTKIKELRESKGLNNRAFTEELASKCGLKLTIGYISYIENYGIIPHQRVIKAFAKFFDIEPVILFDIVKSIKLEKYIERINKKYK